MKALVEITKIDIESSNGIPQRTYELIIVENGSCFFTRGFQKYNSQVLRPGYMIDCMEEVRKLTPSEHFEALQVVKTAKEIKQQPSKPRKVERKVIPIRQEVVKKEPSNQQLSLF